jgi:hydrogenase maturation protease
MSVIVRVWGGVVKRASIVGFGNIFKGDLGIGCYIVDALCQEPLGDSVELSYLGGDLQYAGAYLAEMKFGVIVGGLCIGGSAGSVHCWDKEAFHRNTHWLIEQSVSMRLLAQSLARAEFAGYAPDDLLFLWIEPKVAEGFGISTEARKALRKSVNTLKSHLFRRGFLPETAYRLSSIYQLKVLSTTV